MPDRAMFPRELGLPEGRSCFFHEAAIAVKEEYRNSVRWKRLRCRQVDDLGDDLFCLHVGHSIQFDWTWEGSIAFRPTRAGILPDDQSTDLDAISAWMGDVVEVDETEGYLYVVVNDPQAKPRMGSFYVRPFEFLAQLNAIYNNSRFVPIQPHLPPGLNACRGNVHPLIQGDVDHALAELRQLWQHSWCVLWGPPGTGKTYTIGEQVAECLADGSERILVVSTTNKATDEAALDIGRALRRKQRLSAASHVRRIGKGADYDAFVNEGLEKLLEGSESDLRRQISDLQRQLDRTDSPEERARLRRLIQELRRRMQDASLLAFVNPQFRSIVSTAFNAIRMLSQPELIDVIKQDHAPFTTVVLDEAGLVSRLAVAPMACLASRRVVLVGDPRQLSPITRMSRVLPSDQATWLRSSALTHLQPQGQHPAGIRMLRTQYRMHPQIRLAVSKYQYGNLLDDAPQIATRTRDIGQHLAGQPRAIWYVLDEDMDELPKLRAERGPGNRSWVRPCTAELLDRLFQDPVLAEGPGLFITPFAAQAKAIRKHLGQNGLSAWHASTVHSQQGTEADFVIFDTVNAGSYGWCYDEWQRLINVGVSRACECCIVLASRSEMQEPYLAGLQPQLAPRVFRWRGSRYFWTPVPAERSFPVPAEIRDDPARLGSQLERRTALRPVLSKEQQRLSKLPVDGRPRLVRGVAGSGKSVVLAYWVCTALQENRNAQLWVLYGNAALYKLLENMIHEAWRNQYEAEPLPANRFSLIHIRDLLNDLLGDHGLSMDDFDKYEYDRAAEAYLKLCPPDQIRPRCDAIFIDEAQDFGPNTLRLVARLAKQSQADQPSKRPVMIFYDNAQNVFQRKPPTWAELGIDVLGRSTVMEESFRSTKPITEFALNVLYRFVPPESDSDHRELLSRGLIEETKRNGKDWWIVRFNHIDGPMPTVHKFPDLASEAKAIGDHVLHWITEEGVKPSDIRVICVHGHVRSALRKHVKPKLSSIGVVLNVVEAARVQKGGAFVQDTNTVIAATPNSFKGWDSEVVVLAGADFFAAGSGVLGHSLYTAMTRARSVLAVYAQQNAPGHGAKVMPVLKECRDLLVEGADQDFVSPLDDMNDIIERLGEEHRGWVEGIARRRKIEHEPVTAPSGEILLEPLFWSATPNGKFICFGTQQPSRDTRHQAEDLGFRILTPGEALETQ